jgi:hypothetical protein
MRAADIACALVLVGTALVVTGEGVRLGVGWGTDGPQPGFFVFWLGLVLAVAAGAVAWQAAGRRGRGQAGPRRPFVSRAQLRPVAAVLVPAMLLVAATHAVGLYVAGACYLGIYMRWVGRHSWGLTVLVGLGVPALAFAVFELWFLVPLPKGLLEAALGF